MLNQLLEGYQEFLETASHGMDYCSEGDIVTYLSEQSTLSLIENLRDKGIGNFDVLGILNDSERIQVHEKLDELNDPELTKDKEKLAIGFMVFKSNQKVDGKRDYYSPAVIFPLEHKNNKLEVRNKIVNKLIVKKDIKDEDDLKTIIEFVLNLGQCVLPLPAFVDIPFVLISGKKALETFQRWYSRRKNEPLDESIQIFLLKNTAFIYIYKESAEYLKQIKKDTEDILKNISKSRNKLNHLFTQIKPSIGEDEEERILAERRWLVTENDLTKSQMSNYARILSQPLTAIEGPPGTGKTHLIATFCLDRLLEKYLHEFEKDLHNSNKNSTRNTDYTVLVTSTNNKAVDNVVTKLMEFDEDAKKSFQIDKMLHSCARLGRNEYIGGFISQLKSLVSSNLSIEEIADNKRILREKILNLRDLVKSHKEKIMRCLELKETITQTTDLLKDVDSKIDELFVSRERRDDFSKENLYTFRWLLGRLTRWYVFLPFFGSKFKTDLSEFATERGLRLKGVEDLKYLSCRELYRLNYQIINELSALFNRHSEINQLGELTRKLAEEIAKSESELKELRAYLERTEREFRQNERELLVRLKEYFYWKLQDDDEIKRMTLDGDNVNLWKYWRQILQYFPIVISTALSVRNSFPVSPDMIDTAIVDEGSQTLFCYVLPVYVRAKRFVVIGDKNQLSPVLPNLPGAEKIEDKIKDLPLHLHIRQSALGTVESIDNTEQQKRRLIEHFRCQEPIIKFCDNLIGYGLKVMTKKKRYDFNKPLPSELEDLFNHHLIFIDVNGKSKKQKESHINEEEANEIVKFIQNLRGYVKDSHLGVITPFKAQKDYLRNIFQNNKITIGTVHTFQGDEKEIILFSLVCSEPEQFKRSRLFTKELFNVAVSRAKTHLVCFGQRSAIENIEVDKHPVLKLYEHIKKCGFVT
ncbi:MAG TPA: AAA domain-containing protein [Syntrophorhabdaceae bacterium]|nr:AAA domain-containing protein [Syntrophorhabdaceae bacterium]